VNTLYDMLRYWSSEVASRASCARACVLSLAKSAGAREETACGIYGNADTMQVSAVPRQDTLKVPNQVSTRVEISGGSSCCPRGACSVTLLNVLLTSP
jgi:hypothetical protein